MGIKMSGKMSKNRYEKKLWTKVGMLISLE